MDDYQRDTRKEVEEETAREHRLATKCRYVGFVSKSNGKGRKKRKRLREVELLLYDGKVYQLKTNLTGDLEWIMKSLFPEECIPANFGNDWYGAFLNALRTMPVIKEKKKSKRI